MSIKNGVWHDAKLDPPEDGVTVLCVKELKSGRRDLCFGRHWKNPQYGIEWTTNGGNNNVIYWMPLPKIPEKGDDEP